MSSEATYRIILVQCTNEKRAGEWPARDLYNPSDYFRKQRSYAEAVADQWFIQSAEYGLLAPDMVVKSYDTHASDLDDPEAWARQIAGTLFSVVEPAATVEILGGKDYADPLTPELERRGYEVFEPLRGLMIGERKSKLGGLVKAARNESLEVSG